METYRVDVSEPAEDDLREIIGYIAARFGAPQTALDMLKAVEQALSDLADTPKKHQLVGDERLAAMGYRKLTVKNYCIFYTVDEKNKVIDAERVLYTRRDWAALL